MSLERRTSLSRSTPLTATTGLTRGGGLQRATQLSRGRGPTSRPSQAQRDSWAVWKAVTDQAWVLWDRRCVACGQPIDRSDVHGHHRLLRSQGGPDVLSNNLPLHDSCHSAAHLGGNASYDAGLLVRSWGIPTAWPVTAWDGQQWLVDDGGERWAV